MYNNYTNFLQELNNNNLSKLDFKSNQSYRGILEHVSYEHGKEYLNLVLKEFPNIDHNKIINYCLLNDRFGNPNKKLFKIENKEFECSPTSLRYVYHALLILSHYKTMKNNNIVEVGCGYGGLCLSINYFMSDLEVEITNYHLIDLSEPILLIEKYLDLHKDIIKCRLQFHDSSTFGSNINDTNLFFISNYCYTEISESYHANYTNILLPKVDHGFITWQNGGNGGTYPVHNASNIINKEITKVIDEKPQTDAGYDIYRNYFVYF